MCKEAAFFIQCFTNIVFLDFNILFNIVFIKMALKHPIDPLKMALKHPIDPLKIVWKRLNKSNSWNSRRGKIIGTKSTNMSDIIVYLDMFSTTVDNILCFMALFVWTRSKVLLLFSFESSPNNVVIYKKHE